MLLHLITFRAYNFLFHFLSFFFHFHSLSLFHFSLFSTLFYPSIFVFHFLPFLSLFRSCSRIEREREKSERVLSSPPLCLSLSLIFSLLRIDTVCKKTRKIRIMRFVSFTNVDQVFMFLTSCGGQGYMNVSINIGGHSFFSLSFSLSLFLFLFSLSFFLSLSLLRRCFWKTKTMASH